MLEHCESLQNIQLANQRVFLRLDLNVPLDEEGNITDDRRIQAALPTLQFILQKKAKLIVASHLGRPKGQFVPRYSLLPLAEYLAEKLNKEIIFPQEGMQKEFSNGLRKLSSELNSEQILLLENLRFHPGEESNDMDFSKKLASLCDVYINDAFGVLHRAHASTVGMLNFVPKKGFGFLIEKEIQFLSQLSQNPQKPFVAILGGAKVSDKIMMIEKLLKKVDVLLIGGAMAYTFLKAQGLRVGSSLVEREKLQQASRLLEKARLQGVKMILPKDHLLARDLKQGSEQRTTLGSEITGEWMGVDIGPKTLKEFESHLEKAKTVFWNGPMGAFEISDFSHGTLSLAKKLAQLEATTVVGGGDSLAAVKSAGLAEGITHLSTGGGASLEFLEGKKLPGLVALEKTFKKEHPKEHPE